MHTPRARTAAIATALAVVLAACGGAQTPGVQPGETPPEAVDTIMLTPETEPQTYLLRGGRYRVAWRHTDCAEGITVVLREVNGLFDYERRQRVPQFNTLVQNVPPGEYLLEQANEECEDWELRADRVGN